MANPIKLQIRSHLAMRDYEAIVTYCMKERRAWKSLRSCLYELDDELKWPAIEAIGRLMKHWWENGDQKKVREYMRGLFWLLNDESGGIGWTSAQQIAEIICQIPELADPYGTMVIDRTLGEPPLVGSGLWAIGRQGKLLDGRIDLFERMILDTFDTQDTQTLGLAAWAMGESRFTPALPLLEPLTDRLETVRIFIRGVFLDKPLGVWAEHSIKLLKTG